MEDINVGDSIAVNGVCLTATAFDSNSFVADAMAETLAKTNLNKLAPGDKVNLERALRLGDRLGGHLVTGHVDGVGSIARIERQDIAILITVNAPIEVLRYVVKKGSITIDGTSLTVVDLTSENFQVSLIPHTASHTVLGSKKAGDPVNLEADVLGKYIERFLENRQTSDNANDKTAQNMTMEFLAKHGFA